MSRTRTNKRWRRFKTIWGKYGGGEITALCYFYSFKMLKNWLVVDFRFSGKGSFLCYGLSSSCLTPLLGATSSDGTSALVANFNASAHLKRNSNNFGCENLLQGRSLCKRQVQIKKKLQQQCLARFNRFAVKSNDSVLSETVLKLKIKSYSY